ncbi:unnamed protein product [Phytomonas sp. EM1]|nr:unnamed protein product [Phytomonas sp. EM1]|eukprot:CCW62703.1 unnamed protein product [Phytomonas sp. isolate EM1]
MLHLIDDSGHLKSKEELSEFLSTVLWKDDVSNDKANRSLASIGANYHVVGVLGAQSSGKSTLLNYLFKTQFQMLDESVRRGQTTKGVFLSRADLGSGASDSQVSTGAPLLVVDFEGTDGLERGEDQSFERQLSLFALSMADTLILNMWAVDVGRFNAANLSLLRTIFEINLQLFSHEGYEKDEKPTLLVVLRDFTEGDLKPSLVTLQKSFDTIWENVVKPPRFADSSIADLFSFKYFAMPHLKLQKNEFTLSVSELQSWFCDSQREDFLFKSQSMFRGVPLEDLPSYLTSCWETILKSRDLDIPTQREMLAYHRCKDAKASVFTTFQEFCQGCEERIRRDGASMILSGCLEEEMVNCMGEYERQTKLYRSEVVASYEMELEKDMVNAAIKVLDRVCVPISTDVLNNIEKHIQKAVDSEMNQLLESAQALPFVAASSQRAEDELGGVEGSTTASPSSIASTTFRMDGAGCQDLEFQFWKGVAREVNRVLAVLDNSSASPHLFGRHAALIERDPATRAYVVSLVTRAVLKKLKFRISSMSENASETMHRGFVHCLSHNAGGTVKFFSTARGLMQAVPSAQQAGLVQLGCFLYFRLHLSEAAAKEKAESKGTIPNSSLGPLTRYINAKRCTVSVRQNSGEQDFFLKYTTLQACPRYPSHVCITEPPVSEEDFETDSDSVVASCVLLNQSAMDRAFELYKQKCEFTVQLEMRSIEAGQQHLPAWVIPAICILGFNEFWYIITSPILLTILIFVIFFFFKGFLMRQWQIFEETGSPIIVIPLKTLITRLNTVYCLLIPNPSVSPKHIASAAHSSNVALNEAEGSRAEVLTTQRPQPRASNSVHADPTSAYPELRDPHVTGNLRKRSEPKQD